MDIEDIRGAIESRRDEIIDWLAKLVQFPSENRYPDGYERDVQKFIKRACLDEEWEVDEFSPDSDQVPGIDKHPSWLIGRNYQNERNNVVAVWRGSGNGKSILFSGHSDVAPHGPGNWKVTEPFRPVIKEGRMYGRGTADMKAGLAAGFWAMKVLKDLGFTPEGDVIFEAVVDEEFAGGNGALASRLKGYNADLAIYSEPSGMRISPACLGAFLGDIVIRGRGGMPFTGYEIANPIEGAARVIQLFSDWKRVWNDRNQHRFFTGSNQLLNLVLWNVETHETDEFVQMGTPQVARIAWIVWCYPGVSEDDFYRQFNEFWDEHFRSDDILSQFEIRIEPKFHYVKPWESDPESISGLALTDAFRSFSGREPEIEGAPFSCDMAIYGEAGNPVFILGPRGDNLHAPDEWVLLEDLTTLTGIFAELIVRWCS